MPMEEEIAEIIEAQAKKLAEKVAANFKTFGGGGIRTDDIAIESREESPIRFVSGVDVEEVVRFILWQTERSK